MNAWFAQHRAAFALACRRLAATPLGSLLAILAIGIALTLPGLGYVVLDKLRDLGRDAAGSQQISIFMNLDAGKKELAGIEQRLQAAAARFTFVARDAAWQRLQKREDMAEIVAGLPRNPLPDAFIVEPARSDPAALETMKKEIAGWPGVAHIQLDSAWVMRFAAFLRLGKLALTLLAGLFAAGLVAVTFNTIRLQVIAGAAEIEVARMIGATDAFIRRPFLYFGAVQGALGGLVATGLVLLGLHLLAAPVAELAALYGSDFALTSPGIVPGLLPVLAGGALGWLGAKLSVGHSLRKFD